MNRIHYMKYVSYILIYYLDKITDIYYEIEMILISSLNIEGIQDTYNDRQIRVFLKKRNKQSLNSR
jgi:hypothetical protein